MSHVVALLVRLLLLASLGRGAPPCAAGESAVVVDTAARRLSLCDAGDVEGRFRVALGGGGVGKRREGDRKTPLGVYPLGTARRSKAFGIFIPVGYPTRDQKRRGFTGSAIGIHGPARGAAWLGNATTWADWTDGCIALGSDDDVATVVRWMTARGVHHVRLH